MTFNDLKGTNASSLVGGVTTGANTAAEFSNFSLVNNSSEVGQGTRISTPDQAVNDGDPVLDMSILQRKKKIVDELKMLIDIMKEPNLKIILEDPDLNITSPLIIGSKTTIFEAATLLKNNNTTATLICDSTSFARQTEQIIGILTTKDIALKALAKGIDCKKTSVARIMTPRPSFAEETLPIHTALRLMYEGKFLNLPVKCATGEVTGLVSVLQLTYALLKTLDGSKMNTDISNTTDILEFDIDGKNNVPGDSNNTYFLGAGPAWDKFWESLDRPLSTSPTEPTSESPLPWPSPSASKLWQ
ncbi:unnamed protein product [Ambrosiozyma monospora]|uniref:Unnamed protein product n=1 Tax=Ambrosiozyma monospora TaxID=43982 RepID=A0ACB5U154_AMBMO|nr:unnamed protein product [Ambrosiozyma monospora]